MDAVLESCRCSTAVALHWPLQKNRRGAACCVLHCTVAARPLHDRCTTSWSMREGLHAGCADEETNETLQGLRGVIVESSSSMLPS